MQTNDLGMDEFAALCRLIGVEPYISVNAGFGDARSAADQVEYMNAEPRPRGWVGCAPRTGILPPIVSGSGTSATSPGARGSSPHGYESTSC